MNDRIYLFMAQKQTDTAGTLSVKRDEASMRKVWGKVSSIGMREYYSAAQAGVRADIKVDVYAQEYKGERFFMTRGTYYEIVRTYENGEKLEITGRVMR